MNKELLKQILEKEYNNKDLTIIFEGSLETQFIIHQCQILNSDNTLLLCNQKIQFKIDLDEVTDIEMNNCIILEMESLKIVIDY